MIVQPTTNQPPSSNNRNLENVTETRVKVKAVDLIFESKNTSSIGKERVKYVATKNEVLSRKMSTLFGQVDVVDHCKHCSGRTSTAKKKNKREKALLLTDTAIFEVTSLAIEDVGSVPRLRKVLRLIVRFVIEIEKKKSFQNSSDGYKDDYLCKEDAWLGNTRQIRPAFYFAGQSVS